MAGEPLLASINARIAMCERIASALCSRHVFVDARWVNQRYAICKRWYEGPLDLDKLIFLTGYGEKHA